jgi:hypothetical protein
MSSLTDQPPPKPADPEIRARCELVLKMWQCHCENGCLCFEYRLLLTLCKDGRPLFPKQFYTIEQLLQRSHSESPFVVAHPSKR